MQRLKAGYYFHKLLNKKDHYPFSGQIELTYRCCLNCIHCYCKGLNSDKEERNKELTTFEVKRIFDEIHNEGCLFLTLTGGDPLVRDDFLEIYSYAKEKGFLITLFTTGQAFTDKTINFLVKSPPVSIEITLNGATKDTYESITQVKGSYDKAMETIKLLAKRKLRLTLKSNCLKQNKDEVAKVKALTEELLGRPPNNTYYFKYDPMIYPRLNGDKSVCAHRLSMEEIIELRKQDKDIWREFQRNLHCDFPKSRRDKNYLYRCDSWMNHFFINPYGRLQFCSFFDKFSIDLKTTPFRKGFYEVFPKVLEEKFKTDSKCRDCSLRPICHFCPARAYLETGSEEKPVDYFCEIAQATAEQMPSYQMKPKLMER